MDHRCARALLLTLALCPSSSFTFRRLPAAGASNGSSRRFATSEAELPVELPSLADYKTDPRVWLEDVEGEEALDWVRGRSSHALAEIGDPTGSPVYKRLLDIMDSDEKIPFIGRVMNGLYYNFWQDEAHVRGIWRRCTLEEFRKAEPAWEVVLDLDALGQADGVSWVWGGSTVLDEGPGSRKDRVMIALSRGGADATVAREFDLEAKEFVGAAQGGFDLPECKSRFSYKDRDTLLVGGAFGDDEMTDSGYARTVREWKRGSPLSESKLVYEGERGDVAAAGFAYHDRGERYELRYRALTFYTSTYELKIGTGPEGGGGGGGADGPGFAAVAVPADASIGTFADQLLVTLRSDWLGHGAGSMLAAPVRPFMAARDDAARAALLTPLFEPSASCSLEASTETKNYLILSCLDNVVTEQRFWRYERPPGGADAAAEKEKGGKFTLERTIPGALGVSPSVSAVDSDGSDALWVTSDGYTQPTTLAHCPDASDFGTAQPGAQEPLKQLPAFFDASGLVTEQHYATSKDGTQVPYFLVSKGGAAAMKLDGSTPTLLYGYGGFEVSLTPGYSASVGAAWLEKGYAYAVANIRGGGEYGPRWHQAALKAERKRAYEDFEAVAQDLVDRGVTSPAKLGCQGGSNGGLLTGNMLARPSAGVRLFGAIVCQVPLLDMYRYHTLLAGASWMGEYGDPEAPEEWAYLQHYSPYHNLKAREEGPADQGRGGGGEEGDERDGDGGAAAYPATLFTTSTRDDRVHPGHARKMVKKLLDLGHKATTLYYENMEGGHGGAADNKQRAFMATLAYEFLEQALVKEGGAKTGQ